MPSGTQHSEIRAVQLDLARQKENLQSIEHFIRFASRWGFNTLFLYLEGVIQTPSFPYRARELSYSEDEIRQIIHIAAEAQLDVIPGLATLGHAEHFLAYHDLEHLREGNSWYHNMFCPSNPDTYRFLEAYLGDIAALFPSPHFHIGCDESWALGYCPKCSNRLHLGTTRETLFIEHVLKIQGIVSKLGKQTWMWSDMFETFPASALEKIPKEVILCEWQYSAERLNHDGFQGHFNNFRRRDVLSLHEKTGHHTVICSSTEWNNLFAFTEIARLKPTRGKLLTNWEMETVFLAGVLPSVALAGRLWSCPTEDRDSALKAVLQEVLPNASFIERQAIRYFYHGILWAYVFTEIAYRGQLTSEESRHLTTLQQNIAILTEYLARLAPGDERDIVEEILTQTHLQALSGQFRQAIAELLDPRNSHTTKNQALATYAQALRDLDSLAQKRSDQWRRWRKDVTPDQATPFLQNLSEKLTQLFRHFTETPSEEQALLSLRLFLYDCYSAPRLTVEIFNGNEWAKAFQGTHKPVDLRDASYQLDIPLAWNHGKPEKLRIIVAGFGGQGVQFAQLVVQQHCWVPSSVTIQSGPVVDADALLTDDAFVCFLGEKDTLKTQEALTDGNESVIEIQLRKSHAQDFPVPISAPLPSLI